MSNFKMSILAAFFILSLSISIGYAQSWIPIGLNNKPVTVLAVDPHNSSDIYVGTFYEGFYKSMDGGLTWAELNMGKASITAIEFDSQVSGVVYVMSYSGLFKSKDYGLTWTEISGGTRQYNHMAIDPQTPQTLYMGAINIKLGEIAGGVYKSVNGGGTWTFMGLEDRNVLRLAVDTQTSSTVYAATDSGMFKSFDGGVTWTAINAGLGGPISCNALSLDPDTPKTIYVGTQGGGVNKSTDGGALWSKRNNGITNLNITAIKMDPHSSQNLCAGAGSTVFLSKDGGASWSDLSHGQPPYIGTIAITSDPALSVYGATRREGVYLYTEKPYLSTSPESLNFGFISSNQRTSDRSFSVLNLGGGTFTWTVQEDTPWLSCSPVSGNNIGKVEVTIDASGLSPGLYTSTISIVSSEAFNKSTSITAKLTVYAPGTSNPPIGFFETPEENSIRSGGIALTGWALDDIEVTGVKIYRNPVSGESLQPNGLVYIGDAVFVEGARPDVETAYPDYPLNFRAGWGYMLLTNCLPAGGNGIYTLHTITTDKEGNQVSLGQKTITCDNRNAVKPFGAIDTPTQGGTAFGSDFINFGWALTPQPKSIPIDGSTITVWVDGLPLGPPVYNNYRADIATLFPGYANSNGAVGYYYLDTTGYSNGTHTIAWSVADSDGAVDGIGSRYFQILNTGSGSSFQSLGGVRPNAGIQNMISDMTSAIYVRRGYSFDRPAELVYPDREGRANVLLSQIERVAIYPDLSQAFETQKELQARSQSLLRREVSSRSPQPDSLSKSFNAYLLVGTELRPLPIGATVDTERGVLYWQPGPGFLGEYQFVIVDKEKMIKKTIKITIVPASDPIK